MEGPAETRVCRPASTAYYARMPWMAGTTCLISSSVRESGRASVTLSVDTRWILQRWVCMFSAVCRYVYVKGDGCRVNHASSDNMPIITSLHLHNTEVRMWSGLVALENTGDSLGKLPELPGSRCHTVVVKKVSIKHRTRMDNNRNYVHTIDQNLLSRRHSTRTTASLTCTPPITTKKV